MSKTAPFTYDYVNRTFLFGDEQREIGSISLFGIEPSIEGKQRTPEELDEVIKSEPVLYAAPQRFLMLPKFHSFVREHWSEEIEQEVLDVMADAIPSDFCVPRVSGSRMLGVDYSATRIDREMGRLILGVPGICACFGPDASMVGAWGSQSWGEGVATGSFHNIDQPFQRAGLLAGLGHVAYLAR